MVKRLAIILAIPAFVLDSACDNGDPSDPEDAGPDGGDDADIDGGSDADIDAGEDADVDGGEDADIDGGNDAGEDADVDGGEETAKIFFNDRTQDCSSTTLSYHDYQQSKTVDVIDLGGPDSIVDIAVDEEATWLYYSFGASSADAEDTIERIKLDGTSNSVLATYNTGDLSPEGLAVNSDTLYWLATTGCSPCPSCGDCTAIVSSGLTGANPSKIHTITGSRNVTRLAYAPSTSRLYYSDIQYSPAVEAVGVDGSDVSEIYTMPVGQDGGVGDLEIDDVAGKLYWLEETGSIGDPVIIKRANLDGSDVEELATVGGSQAATPRGLGLDLEQGKLYWSESGFCGDPLTGRIRRANLDGSDVETVADDLGIITAVEVVP